MQAETLGFMTSDTDSSCCLIVEYLESTKVGACGRPKVRAHVRLEERVTRPCERHEIRGM